MICIQLILCSLIFWGQFPEQKQIFWQRNLADALAIVEAEQRPMLIAINTDGESASDRIVVELYRDPEFVALTRHFVCLIAHPLRHAPRDYDERGLRIVCPRLGEATCGEHMAVEPMVFEQYFGGERVSPRHVLIQPNGAKSFDLFYLFDLQEVKHKLQEYVVTAPPIKQEDATMGDWPALLDARKQRIRQQCEKAIAQIQQTQELQQVLAAILQNAEVESMRDALRVFVVNSLSTSSKIINQLKQAPDSLLQIVAELAYQQLQTAGPFPGAPGLNEDRRYLSLFFQQAADSKFRTQLIARSLLSAELDRQAALHVLQATLSQEELSLIEANSAASQINLLQLAAAKTANTTTLSQSPNVWEAISNNSDELNNELDAAEARLAENPNDAEAMFALGMASLHLARLQIEAGGASNTQLLLEDAAHWLEQAVLEGNANLNAIGIARARTAYYLGRFAEEEQLAWDIYQSIDAKNSDDAMEALRWVGDGSLRLLSSRAGGEIKEEFEGIARGLFAFSRICLSPEAGEQDWLSFASFLRFTGLFREELFVAQTAAVYLPEATALRNYLNEVLWRFGRMDLAPHKARWIEAQNPASSASAWFTGYAWMLAAEDSRRQMQAAPALEAYAKAEASFRRAIELDSSNQASATHYLAMCAFGRGFVYLLVDKQIEASQALLDGLIISPNSVDARDGLDREAVDLLDGALEWRFAHISPVNFLQLANQMEKLNLPSRWLIALSDTALREALRADGRSDQAQGNQFMQASIAAARHALKSQNEEAAQTTLVQSLSIHAQRLLEQGFNEEACSLAKESLQLIHADSVLINCSEEQIFQALNTLREQLGPARPVARPGR